MADYSDLGLDGNLRGTIGPVASAKFNDAYMVDSLYEIQQKYLNAAKINLAGLVDLIKLGVGASGTGDFAAGSVLYLSSSITFKAPKAGSATFGHPLIGIYQGTVSDANEIYPSRGTSVTVGRYTVQGDYSYQDYNNISDRWSGIIIDTTGTSTQVITFAANWLYLDYVNREIA